ncbi:MAG: hypothetical protein KAR01_12920 [Desulfocapsa sp.]|nr:hypothetical protein [Desulfocapsa sp.]
MIRGRNIKNIFLKILILCFFIFIPSLSFAVPDSATSIDNQEVLMAHGKVKSFDQGDQFILLKTSKGEIINIALNWSTVLVGYSSFQEIEKKQGIKIWYAEEVDKKIAIKIERKLQVGC